MVTLMRPYGHVTHLIQFWSDVIFRMSCWDLPPDLLIEVRCWRWSMVLSWPAWPVMNCVTPRDVCHAWVTGGESPQDSSLDNLCHPSDGPVNPACVTHGPQEESSLDVLCHPWVGPRSAYRRHLSLIMLICAPVTLCGLALIVKL